MIKPFHDSPPFYPFSHPFVFKKVCEMDHIAEEVIRIASKDIIKPPDLSLMVKQSEKRIEQHIDSKDIVLDVCLANANTVVDLELQKYRSVDLNKRARYYLSLIDAMVLRKGADYTQLKDVIILFVCTYDPGRKGKERYVRMEKDLEESCKPTDHSSEKLLSNPSGYVKIYLNAGKANDSQPGSELSDFLAYVRTGIPNNEFTKKIHQYVIQVNEEERRQLMTFGEMLKLEGEEVAQKTERKARREANKKTESMILRMQQMNYPIDDMVTISGLKKKQVEAILSKHVA